MEKKDKVKIVHLVNDLSIGGVQKVVLDICSSADLTRYEITIYCLGAALDLVSTYSLDPSIKIKTFAYHYDDDFTLKGYFKHTFFKSVISQKAQDIIDAAIKDKPDIVHCHIHPRELNLGILIQEKIKCGLILTQHMRQLNLNKIGATLLGMIFRKTYRKYNIIAVSKGIEADISAHKLLGKNKRLFLIENKLNLNLYNPKPKKPKDYVSVVYVARIGHPKAHDDLIRAWSKLTDEPIPKKLFLIGPDAMNNQIQMLATELVSDDSVVFMGAQYEVADILNECDFAVFPSHKEGLPISLLEKMAMKLPVIASDIPELTSIVEHNVNGLVFKCGDIDDLAEKIKVLLKDTGLRNELGEKARETVENHFGSKNIAAANELAYETILDN